MTCRFLSCVTRFGRGLPASASKLALLTTSFFSSLHAHHYDKSSSHFQWESSAVQQTVYRPLIRMVPAGARGERIYPRKGEGRKLWPVYVKTLSHTFSRHRDVSPDTVTGEDRTVSPEARVSCVEMFLVFVSLERIINHS
jgi:hypothetical protein